MKKIRLTVIMAHCEISTICNGIDDAIRCIRSINTLCDELGEPRPVKLFEEVD